MEAGCYSPDPRAAGAKRPAARNPTGRPFRWPTPIRALAELGGEPGDVQMLDLWVLSHPDLRRDARIMAFTEFIADCIIADRDLFEGRRPFTHG